MEEWRQIGGGLQTIRKCGWTRDNTVNGTWQEIPRCQPAIFSGLIIWISATRPGSPTARFARPGQGPAAIRGNYSYEKMAGSVLAVLVRLPLVGTEHPAVTVHI
jgi:hypothetical protein